MNLPVFPTLSYILILVVSISLIGVYVVLERGTKIEKCRHCGTKNPIESLNCTNCGESMVLPGAKGWHALLGVLGMVMGFAPMILLVLSAGSYPDQSIAAIGTWEGVPVTELSASLVGIFVFIAGFVVLLKMPARRIALKQKATILHNVFYGGYCAKCGTEMLGGEVKCRKCGFKVNAEKPNWAIAAKNGKTGLPVVDLKVTCYKCRAVNPSTVLRCQKCNADLLKYKPVWLRVVYFVAGVLFSLGTGWLVMRALEDPDVFEGLDAIGFGVISLSLITIVMPFYGLYLAFGGGKLNELLAERAERHLKENPWQALEDYGHALELAPTQEHVQIMANRMKLYNTLGLKQNAAREELAISYARERNPQGGLGLYLAGNLLGGSYSDSFTTGWQMQTSKQARKDREKMYAEGRAIVLGYCPVCEEAVELTTDFRCPNAERKGATKHSGKPKILQYVIPADIQAGKVAVMRAVELSRRQLRQRVVTIVLGIIGISLLCGGLNYFFNQ